MASLGFASTILVCIVVVTIIPLKAPPSFVEASGNNVKCKDDPDSCELTFIAIVPTKGGRARMYQHDFKPYKYYGDYRDPVVSRTEMDFSEEEENLSSAEANDFKEFDYGLEDEVEVVEMEAY